jgi:hypothetical protein
MLFLNLINFFLAEFACGWRHTWIGLVARPIEFKVN